MSELYFTLLTDGSSDAALIPILRWLLINNGVSDPIQSQWADLRRLQVVPKSLGERITLSLNLFPCNLLFVHRDAESQGRNTRIEEINAAVSSIGIKLPYICVVPVRMTEAWLLFNEKAIRYAAGNRVGHTPLNLPDINKLEAMPNPKQLLYEALRTASGLRGRRLQAFRPGQFALNIPDHIEDFSALRSLTAFSLLEEDIRDFIRLIWFADQSSDTD